MTEPIGVDLGDRHSAFGIVDQASGDEVERGREKVVVLIGGPPGPGKSVVAAHLWAALAGRPELDGDYVLVLPPALSDS